MALPLKDFPLAISQHAHKILQRISDNRGIHLNVLGREIIDAYVAKAIHDAKVVLGQDDDNGDEAESDGGQAEEGGIVRSQREPRGVRR